jgi:hypothetical protein
MREVGDGIGCSSANAVSCGWNDLGEVLVDVLGEQAHQAADGIGAGYPLLVLGLDCQQSKDEACLLLNILNAARLRQQLVGKLLEEIRAHTCA